MVEHPKVIIGWDSTSVVDLNQHLSTALQQKCDFICAPLFHPRYRRDEAGVSRQRETPQTRSDMVTDSQTWTTMVVGTVSEWIDMDSPCRKLRQDSESALKQEIAWASHLSVPAVMLPTPNYSGANYARTLLQLANDASYIQFWVKIPTKWPEGVDEDTVRIVATRRRSEHRLEQHARRSPWEVWNRLRTLADTASSISVALELTADLPSAAEMKRWMGEPVKAVILPVSIFLTNAKGYPTLSPAHQAIVIEFMKYKPQLIIKGVSQYDKGVLFYVQYLEYLSTKRPPITKKDQYEKPYLDYLQAPLQPLMDNLESQTYETFERDPVKYEQYEAAVTAALMDTPEEKTTVLMVVGAGRGPLVRASLRAASSADRKIRVYAVEKNPNAVITLRNMKITELWGDTVTIVASDMRTWVAPEKADILVSELLGSWGDNELSPECLDGAQKFLKPDGISIPKRYTSFVCPIMSSKLWNDVKAYKDLKHFETPYVVRLHNIFQLAEPQACFTFEHPNWSERIDNRRHLALSFVSQESGVVHGLAGYFDAQLYGEHDISIVPATHSRGMFSWFPLYIPIQSPLYVKEGERVEVFVWRMVSEERRKVWYEWAVEVEGGQAGPIHNPGGRSYWIGL